MVQSESPDQAERPGPQLFSFKGDNFPSKPSTSKKFEHLKTKWFYSQFGDATGTGGRQQDIIPLQAQNGQFLAGGGGGGGGGGSEQGQAKEGSANQPPAINVDALVETLGKAQDVIEKTNEQIANLARNEAKDQSWIKRLESW